MEGTGAGSETDGLTLGGSGICARCVAVANFEGNGAAGVYVKGAPDVVLRDNVISGNGAYCVHITGSGAKRADIYDNIIGLDADGDSAIGNTRSGVHVDGASNVAIDLNVIGGNGSQRVSLTSSGTYDTYIRENYIVTNEHETGLGNGGSGVHIDNGSLATSWKAARPSPTTPATA